MVNGGGGFDFMRKMKNKDAEKKIIKEEWKNEKTGIKP